MHYRRLSGTEAWVSKICTGSKAAMARERLVAVRPVGRAAYDTDLVKCVYRVCAIGDSPERTSRCEEGWVATKIEDQHCRYLRVISRPAHPESQNAVGRLKRRAGQPA